MVNKLKYSKNNLLKFISLFDRKIYLLFLDLNKENFDNSVSRLNKILEIVEKEIIEVHKEKYLVIFGYLNFQKLQALVDEIDSMDISEFEMSEYQGKQEIIKLFLSHSNKNEKTCKSIYVNKDEMIIQYYNFY